MKRLLRNLWRVVAAVSLAVSVLLLAVWVRSHWAAQYVGWSSPHQWYGVLSMQGLLRCEHGTYEASKPGWGYITYPVKDRTGLWSELNARDRHTGSLQRFGFGVGMIDYYSDGRQRRYFLYAPHWAAAILFAIPPGAVLPGLVLRRRRRAANQCAACGYDLRATPDRCPECGVRPELAKMPA